MPTYRFTSALYHWQARTDTWVFANLPEDMADEIEDAAPQPRRGFGAIRVRVELGGSAWQTSLFPSSEDRTLVLPVKRAVLRAEGVDAGDTVAIAVTPML